MTNECTVDELAVLIMDISDMWVVRWLWVAAEFVRRGISKDMIRLLKMQP
jgi:hypothetical protein